MSVVIGPLPQIAPKKHWVPALWQSGMQRRGRPISQWCVLPAYERGLGWRHRHWWIGMAVRSRRADIPF